MQKRSFFPKKILLCFYKAADDMIRHDGIEHAGYMAFLSLLSLFPFLVFLMALVGTLGESELGAQFVHLLLSNLPQRVTVALEPRIQEIISGPPQGLMQLAIIGAIWTASSAVEGLRTILNRVYRVHTPPPYIWRRMLSVIQFLVLTIVIILAMFVLILLPLVSESLSLWLNFTSFLDPVWVYLRYAVIGFTLFGGVACLYYLLPNIRLRWFEVVPGALMVVILWLFAGIVFSMYLSHFQQVKLIYGSLGGIIVALLFFYIINMLFIYGAEFNYLLWKSLREQEVTA